MADNYWELSKRMRSADPRLIHWNVYPAAGKPAGSYNRSSAIALRLRPDNSIEDPIAFVSASRLRNYLRRPSGEPQRSIYILEGLAPEFVEAFGGHFRLHPSVFLDHERLVAFDDRPTGEAGGMPFLVSTIRSKEHISLKYHEPLVFSPPPTSFRNFCDHTGRHIGITRVMGKLSPVGVARQKCSFWCRGNDSDAGWDCLIICDPPIERLRDDYSNRISHEALLGATPVVLPRGYVFLPAQLQHVLDLDNPMSVRMFLERIVASHCTQLANYLRETIEVVQWNLSRQRDLSIFAISAVEEQWSDIQSWDRRLGECRDHLEAIMLQLHVPLEFPAGPIAHGAEERAADFQYLLRRFKELHYRIGRLNSAITGLASISGNRQAFRSSSCRCKPPNARSAPPKAPKP
ncbi:hypothetical protein Asppvi_011138 [Aspergillus pseudoviridinutans]|uniref:Uncharacterized protein n=1 Tax=Aspergillus pseudoviridinutans TaxID=1517512 RepID=A0A9P3BIZ2_9EURO|nr:uncharacterized protein Asppvi_011138 [Aspergillus pseudoviridinutans]GIJ92162.1 hypothetical protein Asppvi_011138 [Aspergillus pseudoviridinutans]